jgi:hypothetical protein
MNRPAGFIYAPVGGVRLRVEVRLACRRRTSAGSAGVLSFAALSGG